MCLIRYDFFKTYFNILSTIYYIMSVFICTFAVSKNINIDKVREKSTKV